DGKRRVTCIVKDNVLRGCQLFNDVFREVGAGYPEVEKDVAIVDAFTQWLIGQPEFYDVCVTTNMFGDIVTDLASVLQGGMGMAGTRVSFTLRFPEAPTESPDGVTPTCRGTHLAVLIGRAF